MSHKLEPRSKYTRRIPMQINKYITLFTYHKCELGQALYDLWSYSHEQRVQSSELS